MLGFLKRKIKFLSSSSHSNEESPFSAKLDITKDNIFLGVVLDVDTENDYIRVHLFHLDDDISIPNQLDLGLKQNDMVLVARGDGVFHLLGKTNIEHNKSFQHVFSIKDGTLTKKPVDGNVRKFYKDIHFDDFTPGEIIRHIKVTGYRINEKFIDIFSGIARFTLTFSHAFMRAYNIMFKLVENDSYIHFKETKDKKAYHFFFWSNEDSKLDKKYFIEIKGDVETCLSEKNIKINNPPFDFDNVVYMKIIMSSKPFAKKKSKIEHEYIDRKNNFIGEGEDKINSNVYDKINSFTNAENLFDKELKITFNSVEFYPALIEINDIYGHRKIFSISETIVVMNESNHYKEKNLIITDKNTLIWQSSYEEYNNPYSENSFKITKNYSNEEYHNFYNRLNKFWREYQERNLFVNIQAEHCSNCDLRTMKIEYSPIYYFKGNNINYHLQNQSDNPPIYSINLDSPNGKINNIISVDNGFILNGKKEGEDFGFLLNKTYFLSKGIENVIFNEAKFASFKDANTFVNNLLINESISAKKNFILSSGNSFIVKAKNIYLEGEQIASKAEYITSIASKNIVLYVSDIISASQQTQTSALFLTPSFISTTPNISLPGYCKC